MFQDVVVKFHPENLKFKFYKNLEINIYQNEKSREELQD